MGGDRIGGGTLPYRKEGYDDAQDNADSIPLVVILRLDRRIQAAGRMLQPNILDARLRGHDGREGVVILRLDRRIQAAGRMLQPNILDAACAGMTVGEKGRHSPARPENPARPSPAPIGCAFIGRRHFTGMTMTPGFAFPTAQ